MLATFARNSEIKDDIVYVGPMGCQTGFYLLVRNEQSEVVLSVVKSVLRRIINHDGEIFGNKREECGNYRNLNLDAAKLECQRYLDVLESSEETFSYE
jgi:S-ribosylhomocysteine lyase